MAQHKLADKDVIFYSEDVTVYVCRGGSQMPVLQVWQESQYYSKGLQINHRNLVDMRSVTNAICGILENLALSDLLTEDRYDNLVASVSKYLVRHKSFNELSSFLKGSDW